MALKTGTCATCSADKVKLRPNPFTKGEECETCRKTGPKGIIGITDIKKNYALKDEDLDGLQMVKEPKPAFVGGPDRRWYLLKEIEKRVPVVLKKREKEAKKRQDERKAKENAKEAARLLKEQLRQAKADERAKNASARDIKRAARVAEKAAKEAEKKRERGKTETSKVKKATLQVATKFKNAKKLPKAHVAINTPVRAQVERPARVARLKNSVAGDKSEDAVVQKKK